MPATYEYGLSLIIKGLFQRIAFNNSPRNGKERKGKSVFREREIIDTFPINLTGR